MWSLLVWYFVFLCLDFSYSVALFPLPLHFVSLQRDFGKYIHSSIEFWAPCLTMSAELVKSKFVRRPSIRPSVSQLSLNLLHGFLSNCSCWVLQFERNPLNLLWFRHTTGGLFGFVKKCVFRFIALLDYVSRGHEIGNRLLSVRPYRNYLCT